MAQSTEAARLQRTPPVLLFAASLTHGNFVSSHRLLGANSFCDISQPLAKLRQLRSRRPTARRPEYCVTPAALNSPAAFDSADRISSRQPVGCFSSVDAGPVYSEHCSMFDRSRCVAHQRARRRSPTDSHVRQLRLCRPTRRTADSARLLSDLSSHLLRLLTCVVVSGLPILCQDHVKPAAQSLHSNAHDGCRRPTRSDARSLERPSICTYSGLPRTYACTLVCTCLAACPSTLQSL